MSEIIKTPDLGVDSAEVIELLVDSGDNIAEGQGIILVESDKASMEIPAPIAGVLVSLMVKVGDSITEGKELAEIDSIDAVSDSKQQQEESESKEQELAEPVTTEAQNTAPITPDDSAIEKKQDSQPPVSESTDSSSHVSAYAGPGVRKLARELGVDLSLIGGTGVRARILKEDVKNYVKHNINKPDNLVNLQNTSGSAVLDKSIDFSIYGDTDSKPMTRLHQLTADAMTKSWLSVPRVTQFDQADITDLEDFRKQTNNLPENKEQGTRLTLLSFLVKASISALKKYPQFNVAVDGYNIISKGYYNIGIAVDTPAGLMVPVIKEADSKSLTDIAIEISELAGKARGKTISPQDMQGGCFTISSIGGIGGTGFTPIVNYPEVAIMGVANSSMQPVWNGSDFIPRLICPLSLSYDHRAVNGADAARFLSYIAKIMSDIRKLLI